KEECLIVAVVNLGYVHRTAKSEPESVVAYWCLFARCALARYRIAVCVKKTTCIESVVSEVYVRASVQVVGASLGSVFDESTAGMSVLSRVGRGDDLHLLDALSRRRAFLALLVTYRVTKGSAIEEVFRSPGLAAVDTRVELAAAKHRVAVRLHWKIAGLDLQHGLGKTNVRRRDDRNIPIVLLIHRIAYVRCRYLSL